MDALQAIHDQLDEYLEKTSLLPADLETPFLVFNAANVVPGPQETMLINTVVSERNTQLSTLASQMTSVDNAIRKLAEIRAKLEENADHVRRSLLAHQALTSPSRRIPPEVFGEVFYHCLPKTPHITPKVDECPMMLTHVCRYWRAVALSTPRLWSSLSIHLQKSSCEGYRHGCEVWLARAKSVPLVLRVLNDFNMFDVDATLVLSLILGWLRPLIGHCSDLWWHGPSLSTLFVLETGAETDLPIQRLRITSHRDIPSLHLPALAKSLRFVSLQCLSYNLQTLDRIKLPWDHLVELNMHFALVDSTLFLQLLTRCSRLRGLVVSCLCADEDQFGVLRVLPPGSIVHPLLRRIEIKVIRAGLGLLFSALTLPVLEEIDVCFCYRERDAWPHAAFLEMIGRSCCLLKRLTVRSNKNAVPYFQEYVEAMPGLAVSTSAPDRRAWSVFTPRYDLPVLNHPIESIRLLH